VAKSVGKKRVYMEEFNSRRGYIKNLQHVFENTSDLNFTQLLAYGLVYVRVVNCQYHVSFLQSCVMIHVLWAHRPASSSAHRDLTKNYYSSGHILWA